MHANIVRSQTDYPIDYITFAKIDEVSPNSPADIAGLMVDDLVVSVGSVNSENHNNLKALGELVHI